MKHVKRIFLSLLIALSLTFSVVDVFPGISTIASVEAATKVKLSKTKATLYTGETLKLKVTGTKSKIKWSSNNSTVAKVSSTGKVMALRSGNATITAQYGKKSLSCKVTVKYKNTGNGTVVISTANGSSKNGKIPKQYISPNTLLCQIGFEVSDFNHKFDSYIYIDGKLIEKKKFSNTTTVLTLTGDSLKKGTHTVEVVQYKNNNTKSDIITYKIAKYKILYK